MEPVFARDYMPGLTRMFTASYENRGFDDRVMPLVSLHLGGDGTFKIVRITDATTPNESRAFMITLPGQNSVHSDVTRRFRMTTSFPESPYRKGEFAIIVDHDADVFTIMAATGLWVFLYYRLGCAESKQTID